MQYCVHSVLLCNLQTPQSLWRSMWLLEKLNPWWMEMGMLCISVTISSNSAPHQHPVADIPFLILPEKEMGCSHHVTVVPNCPSMCSACGTTAVFFSEAFYTVPLTLWLVMLLITSREGGAAAFLWPCLTYLEW